MNIKFFDLRTSFGLILFFVFLGHSAKDPSISNPFSLEPVGDFLLFWQILISFFFEWVGYSVFYWPIFLLFFRPKSPLFFPYPTFFFYLNCLSLGSLVFGKSYLTLTLFGAIGYSWQEYLTNTSLRFGLIFWFGIGFFLFCTQFQFRWQEWLENAKSAQQKTTALLQQMQKNLIFGFHWVQTQTQQSWKKFFPLWLAFQQRIKSYFSFLVGEKKKIFQKKHEEIRNLATNEELKDILSKIEPENRGKK